MRAPFLWTLSAARLRLAGAGARLWRAFGRTHTTVAPSGQTAVLLMNAAHLLRESGCNREWIFVQHVLWCAAVQALLVSKDLPSALIERQIVT